MNKELTNKVREGIDAFYKRNHRGWLSIHLVEVSNDNVVYIYSKAPEFVIETNGSGVKELAGYLNKLTSEELKIQVEQH